MRLILLTLALFLTSCYGTYYITDAEYSDVRETHASLTYHQGNIYWGWHSGYYYYYGTPHYYPWYYYYNTCPPSHYTITTHIIITKPVSKPTHRPNRPNRPNRPTYKPNNNKSNITIKTNTNVKNNINRNKSNKSRVNIKRSPK
jgi:hypothetical protein